MVDPDGGCNRRICQRQAGTAPAMAIGHAAMTFLDRQTDEHALDAIDRLATIPDTMQPIAAAGVMHAGLTVIAQHLGHGLATELLRDLQRQLDHWRDGEQIDL